MADFETVKQYLFELGYDISNADNEQELVIISDESAGICNLIIDCESPLVIFEQLIFELKNYNEYTLLKLLQMNRQLVHGAFAVDEDGKKVLFRDTLEIENLDLNEIKGTIDALSLAMAEFGADLLELSK